MQLYNYSSIIELCKRYKFQGFTIYDEYACHSDKTVNNDGSQFYKARDVVHLSSKRLLSL